jgi:hypothetical protein
MPSAGVSTFPPSAPNGIDPLRGIAQGPEHIRDAAPNLTDAQLKNAPHYTTGEEWKWDPARGRDIYEYYDVMPYWPMM